MNEAHDAMIGQQIGNYCVLQLLGRGGFASVYLAENIHIKTRVAIKVLHTQIARDEIEHFRDEARTIAELKHPHIIQLLDFGVDASGQAPYLIMNYAPHGSLRSLHRANQRVALSTVVSYVQQIADALQFAHNRHIVHRDVKPENVLLGEQQELLLSDFGIALVVQTSHQQSTKDVTGTFAYMAPEQTQGKPVAASDQYALGIMAYEWLVGERPFQGSVTELIAQHYIAPPPPLRERNAALPLAVEEVILRALAKKPQERFASVKAFADALTRASRGSTGQFSALAPTLAPSESRPPRANGIDPTEQARVQKSTPPWPPTVAAESGPLPAPETTGRRAQMPPPAQLRAGRDARQYAPPPPPQYQATPPHQGYYAPSPTYPPPQYVAMPVAPRRRKNSVRVGCLTGVVILVALVIGASLLNSALSNLSRHTSSTTSTSSSSTLAALSSDSNTLYLADWSKGLNHWTGGSEWKWIQNGVIGSDGGQNNQNYGNTSTDYLLFPPYRPPGADIEIDAQIQYLRSTSYGGDFGIILRVDGSQDGYLCGFDISGGRYDIELMQNGQGSTTSLTNSNSNDSVTMDNQYHTYKVKIQKNTIVLFVDGQQVAQAIDNTYLSAGAVGLRAYSALVDVQGFRVEHI